MSNTYPVWFAFVGLIVPPLIAGAVVYDIYKHKLTMPRWMFAVIAAIGVAGIVIKMLSAFQAWMWP